MTSKEAIEKKIDELKSLADEIETGALKLIQETPLEYEPEGPTYAPSPSFYRWKMVPDNLRSLQRETERKYQIWYSTAHQLVKENLPEREKEFVSYYQIGAYLFYSHGNGMIQWLRLINEQDTSDKTKIKDNFIKIFDIQLNILLSIPYVLDSRELDLRKIIAADFIESELDKAEYLYKNNFERCAGVIAGVALERHLQVLCDKYKIEYKHNDTIEPLAQALSKAGKIDSTELKNFIHLGGIRNDCAHPKDIPEEDLKGRAKEIIEKVKKLTL
jgi:hypothetical protein